MYKRQILIGSGLQDTVNYALTSPENHARLALVYAPLGGVEDGAPYVELANPIAVERRVLRRSLLVSALESLQYNRRYADRLAMFEIGRAYLPAVSYTHLDVYKRQVFTCTASAEPRCIS